MSPNEIPKTVLITGGCGYLGSQLIRDLVASQCMDSPTIRILDNMQNGNYHALLNLPTGDYQFIEEDILNPFSLDVALQGVDAVVHLAAVVKTPMSFENPVWVEQVNHWGTERLIEACLRNHVHRFIFASSAAVYGPGGPYKEADPCRPVGAYAQSKYRAETAVLEAVERGLNPTILRFGTLFGIAPVVRFDAVANRFAYLAGTSRPLTVYGRGDQRRPLVHVRDASDTICYFLKNPQSGSGEIVNITYDNVSVLDLVDIISKIHPDTRTHFTEQDILTHASYEVDLDKQSLLGLLKSPISLFEGLEALLHQFRNFTPFLQIVDSQ